MKRALLVTSTPGLAEFGDEVLRKGGSAVKAALTCFFVAAGQRPGVLFAPLAILVSGVGAGVRVYDGRARQPGLGQKRPRGFVEGEEIPRAAHAAVPGSCAALALACAYAPGTSLLSCARPGVQAAKQAGSTERAELIETAGSHGAGLLGQSGPRRAFLGQLGPAEGGNFAAADLQAPRDLDGAALLQGNRATLPWAEDSPSDEDAPRGLGQAIVCIDTQGLLVALGYRELTGDLILDPYDVLVPSLAAPVQRGVSRLAPGSPLPLRLQLEAERDDSGAWVRVRAGGLGPSGERSLSLGRDPRTKSVAELG